MFRTIVSAPLKNVIFRRNEMSFFVGQHTSVYSLNYRPTCRLEARQVLIYQCILDLTGENDKYNYSMAVHFYSPFSYILCSAKNYKIASALTDRGAFEARIGYKLARKQLRQPEGFPAFEENTCRGSRLTIVIM